MTELMAPSRVEVLIAGVGGKGVLLVGQILAQAAASLYEHAVWFPSFSATMRGGPCECTVTLSNQRIGSLILLKVQSVIVLEPSQLAGAERRVRPGGLLIVEKAGLKDGALKGDYRAMAIPAVEMALRSTGGSQSANFVLLGAYIGATHVIPAELIEGELKRRLGGRPDVLAKNHTAFMEGVQAAINYSYAHSATGT